MPAPSTPAETTLVNALCENPCYEITLGGGVCFLSGSTITKRVWCSWSKSESASITSLGGASTIASRIRSAIATDSWSARSKALWFSLVAKLQPRNKLG